MAAAEPEHDVWSTRARRACDAHQLGRRLGMALLALAFAYVTYKGTLALGAKDIDARYFYVAGKVWLSGHSPYDLVHYGAAWRSNFGGDVEVGGFAYLPGSILFCAPLALLPWPAGGVLLRVLSFFGLLVIVMLALSYTRRVIQGPLRLRHYAWIAFGAAMGGVSSTVLTGQSTVLVAAASLVVATLPLRLGPLMVPALLLASAKPQISGPILAMVFIADKTAWRRLLVAALFAMAATGAILALDDAPLGHLIAALRGSSNLGANDASRMIGLGPMMRFVPLPAMVVWALGWLTLGVVIAAVAVPLSGGGASGTRERCLIPAVLMAGFVSIGLAYPFHTYDTAMFAPACAMAGLLSGRRQALLFPAFLIMGRPRLISWLLGQPDAQLSAENLITGALWLAVLVALVLWAVTDGRQRRLSLVR